MAKDRLRNAWNSFVPVLASISVEPVFLLDGFAFSNMVVHVESLQFDKICKVNLNYTDEICKNFDSYPEKEHAYNVQVSNFKRNDGAITSIIPLFFILFIGAWSDKYGRKVPLCLTLFCHILFSGGYLLNSLFFTLPVEFLLGVGFLDSIGGGAVAFLTVSNAYISDVTSTEQRTSRVALSNSLWFLGGPLGTLIGTEIFKQAGYSAVFTTSFILYIIAFFYVALLLPESHGPFSDKERLRKISAPKPTLRMRDTIIRVYGLSKKKKSKVGKTESEEDRELRKSITWRKMTLDFFDIRRVLMSFKCVFKKRDGYTRLFIFLLIFSNFLRKIGRGAYAFYFTKEVLKWETVDYGYWVTYKNFISTMGSLLAVPILSTRLKVSDNSLAMIGAMSSIVDYFMYGLVMPTTYILMWIAPATSLLINSCSIATRAMMSKYVNPNELGQVSAVTGTMEGVVPIISTSLYSAITRSTFESYPGAQYFFGSTCNLLMALIFVFIMMLDKSEDYDLENAKPQQPSGPVKERAIVMRKDSKWLYDEQNNNKIRLATILLTALNFSIEVPSIERVYSNKGRKKLSIIDEDLNGVENDLAAHGLNNRASNVPKQNGIRFAAVQYSTNSSEEKEDVNDNNIRIETVRKNGNVNNHIHIEAVQMDESGDANIKYNLSLRQEQVIIENDEKDLSLRKERVIIEKDEHSIDKANEVSQNGDKNVSLKDSPSSRIRDKVNEASRNENKNVSPKDEPNSSIREKDIEVSQNEDENVSPKDEPNSSIRDKINEASQNENENVSPKDDPNSSIRDKVIEASQSEGENVSPKDDPNSSSIRDKVIETSQNEGESVSPKDDPNSSIRDKVTEASQNEGESVSPKDKRNSSISVGIATVEINSCDSKYTKNEKSYDNEGFEGTESP